MTSWEQLSAELARATHGVAPALVDVFRDGVNEVRDKWKQGARASSGVHARQYASHITASTKVSMNGITSEVGPWMSGQGNLGSVLEFGSENNPAHLDGNAAVDAVQPHLERRFDATIGFLLP